jgi:hypothetical protein
LRSDESRQASGLTKARNFQSECDWTPEQVSAVVELFEDLRDRILVHYQLPVMALVHEERGIIAFDLDTTNI